MESDAGWAMSWLWVTVGGPVVLIILFAYVLLTKRRLTRRERIRQKEAVEDLYDSGKVRDPHETKS